MNLQTIRYWAINLDARWEVHEEQFYLGGVYNHMIFCYRFLLPDPFTSHEIALFGHFVPRIVG